MQNTMSMRAAGRTVPVAESFLGTLFQAASTWVAERRAVARVEAELNLHSDRELADLGMSRADIPSVARGYFKRRA